MRNIKEFVVSNLDAIFGEDNVLDEYPHEFKSNLIVLVTEEQNNVYESAEIDDHIKETKSEVEYRIDIWSKGSTSESAVKVDEAIGAEGLGLKRTMCKDVPDASGMKHKLMRFTGIIDMNNDFVEWRY